MAKICSRKIFCERFHLPPSMCMYFVSAVFCERIGGEDLALLLRVIDFFPCFKLLLYNLFDLDNLAINRMQLYWSFCRQTLQNDCSSLITISELTMLSKLFSFTWTARFSFYYTREQILHWIFTFNFNVILL